MDWVKEGRELISKMSVNNEPGWYKCNAKAERAEHKKEIQ